MPHGDPELDELDELISNIMNSPPGVITKEEAEVPVDVALTPMDVTVSTSAKEEETAELPKRRGRPKGSKNRPRVDGVYVAPDDDADYSDDPNLPLCMRLPDAPENVMQDEDGTDLSHMARSIRIRYWEARKAAYIRKREKGLI